MAPPGPRILTVVRSTQLTPNMQRITFGGDALADFPVDQESSYFKLRFAALQPKGIALKSTLKKLLNRGQWVTRSYTVRSFDAATRELDVDFVLHEDGGPAADWARKARPGDQIVAIGHGPKKLVDMSADWFLLAGDMSALPAIAANIEKLPRNARGYAVIEIMDAEDRQPLEAPAGLDVQWIVNADHDRSRDVLLEAVRSLPWQAGRVSAWVAGELNAIRAVRDYLRKERGVERTNMYASSYWQIGRTDEEHRVEKSRDEAA
jgi:NADPH-dependent ferric siderophore reductase